MGCLKSFFNLFLFAFLIFFYSCGSEVNVHIYGDKIIQNNNSSDNDNSSENNNLLSEKLSSVGFVAPYTDFGNAATPVLEVDVDSKFGMLELFSDSSCSKLNLIGRKYSFGDSDSVKVRLGNLTEGNIKIFAKFTDANLVSSECIHIENYDLSNKNYGITSIVSTDRAFSAIRSDGSVITWGDAGSGGDSSSVSAALDGTIDVISIVSTISSFAAIRSDGSVITWGNAGSGGDSSSVSAALDGTIDVTSIVSTSSAFAAIRSDGSVITWGDAGPGGDSSSVSAALDGTIDVTSIVSTISAFAAIRSDGSVITWGNASFGGDSSSVASVLKRSPVKVSVLRSGFCAEDIWDNFLCWGYKSIRVSPEITGQQF